jgi:hypothetical protein
MWYPGRDAIRDLLLRGPLGLTLAIPPHHGQRPARLGTYLWDDALQLYLPGGLDVLTIAVDRRRRERVPHL